MAMEDKDTQRGEMIERGRERLLVLCLSHNAGLQIGYDAGILMFGPFVHWKQNLPDQGTETALQHTIAIILFQGALFGFLLGRSVNNNKLGKRLPFLAANLLSFCGGLLTVFAQNLWLIVLGRMLIGMGVAMVSAIVPVYISQLSPAKTRRNFLCFHAFNIVIGLVVASMMLVPPSAVTSAVKLWRLMAIFNPLIQILHIFMSHAFKYLDQGVQALKYPARTAGARFSPQFAGFNTVFYYSLPMLQSAGIPHSLAVALSLLVSSLNMWLCSKLDVTKSEQSEVITEERDVSSLAVEEPNVSLMGWDLFPEEDDEQQIDPLWNQ